MPLIINQKRVDNDPWYLVDETTLSDDKLPKGQIILPLKFYQEQQADLAKQGHQVAISIDGDDDISEVLADPNQFLLIAVKFPILRDGRGFSIARLLKRAGFKGEIRAIGSISYDRLQFMARCGFNAFDIPAEHFNTKICNAFQEISIHYQDSEGDGRPIYYQ